MNKFVIENFSVVERELDVYLSNLCENFIRSFYGKSFTQCNHEEMQAIEAFAFKNVGSTGICRGLRIVVKRWESFHSTTLDGGEYLKELNLREGED